MTESSHETRLIYRRCRCGTLLTVPGNGCHWHEANAARYASDLLAQILIDDMERGEGKTEAEPPDVTNAEAVDVTDVAAEPTEPAHPVYRVGRKCARNIYLINPRAPWGDVHIGCMFSPEYGPIVVAALNAMHANVSARP